MNTRQKSPETEPPHSRWLCIELPVIEYREAWNLQTSLVTARKDKIIDRDMILLLEHFPVFTLGHRGGLNNLKVSEDILKKTGISVIHTERGGDITFHAAGQLVIYPVIDLRAARMSVTDYVENLEEVMIQAAADWGIRAERNPLSRGVWVDNNKLGSIGIAIRRGICFHGMAFNVNLSLAPFGWINPCGLDDIRVTSMERELSRKIPMYQVRKAAKHHIEEIFDVELIMTDLEKLNIED